MKAALSEAVRRGDEARWLAAQLASPEARHRLIALYAVNLELARAAQVAAEPTLAAMRTLWWREAIAEALAGRPAAHPALQALAAAHAETPFDTNRFTAMAEARSVDAEPAPFPDWDALFAYLDATAGGLIALAAQACGATIAEPAARAAGRAWGLSGLLRAEPWWTARGATWRPAIGGDDARARAAEALAQARAALNPVAVALMPALAYLTLAGGQPREGALIRRARVAFAALRGRV